jgi:oligopeptide/dipeptide ABC transporter ATP-binding protein
MTDGPIFEARDLVKHFPVRHAGYFAASRGTVHAVNSVSFHVDKGETLALVGESGCGKTTLARTAALLHRPTAGSVHFEGRDLGRLSRGALKAARRRVQMIFQDPYGSLNPRLPAGDIIAEPLVIHGIGDKAERRRRVAGLAESVGLRPADMDRYPHQFSGGQRQRIAIARALALEPALIIADEPVSALDVSIQSQVLNLLKDLQENFGLTYLFVRHDLAVVRQFADRVAVMYLGTIVEEAATDDLFANPRHPYTRALIASAPVVGRGKRRPGDVLPGDVPSPLQPPPGCHFHTRCPLAEDVCRKAVPVLEAAGNGAGHRAACHFKVGGPR